MHPTPASISERPIAGFYRCTHPAGRLGGCHWALKTCVASFIRGQGSWWWEAEKTWHAPFVTFFFLNNWGLRRCKACVSVIKLEMWLPSSQSGFFPMLTGMWELKQKEMTVPLPPRKRADSHRGLCHRSVLAVIQSGLPLGPSLSRTHDWAWDQHQIILTLYEFSVKGKLEHSIIQKYLCI